MIRPQLWHCTGGMVCLFSQIKSIGTLHRDLLLDYRLFPTDSTWRVVRVGAKKVAGTLTSQFQPPFSHRLENAGACAEVGISSPEKARPESRYFLPPRPLAHLVNQVF